MRLLLDTHAFLWWLAGHRSLSARARAAIDEVDAEIFVSAASAWEMATKFHVGKLPEAELVASDVPAGARLLRKPYASAELRTVVSGRALLEDA